MIVRTLAFIFLVATLATLIAQSAIFAGSFTISQVRTFEITHDNSPWIYYVESVTETPTEAQNKTIYVAFNVTDADGVANLNDSTALVRISLGDIERNSSSCSGAAMNDTHKGYNCSITIAYYDLGGTWSVNASIMDNNTNAAENTTQTLTMNDLTAVTLSLSEMGFGTVTSGDQDQASTDNPLVLNNTGNTNISQVNVTAYTLEGVTNNSYIIGVGNFTFNVSDSANGVSMINATAVTVPAANVSVHSDSEQFSESLYLYMDVPLGLLAQQYISISEWVLEVSSLSGEDPGHEQ